MVGAADVAPRRRPSRPSACSSLSSAVASGPSGSEPGTASSARPAASEREAFGRREPQRALEVLGEADRRPRRRRHHDVDEPVGRVRRQAAHREQLEVLARARARRSRSAAASSVDRRPRVREDPRHEREDRAGAAARPAARGSRRALRRRDRSSHVDDVGAQLGGLEHLGVLEEAEHEGAERLAVHDRELDDDRAVVAPLDDRVVARARRRPARRGVASTSTRAVDGLRRRRRSSGSSRQVRRRGRRRAAARTRRARRRPASPSMRSTRNARGASRSRSRPTTYQCPKRWTTPYGSSARGSPRYVERRRRAASATASKQSASAGVDLELRRAAAAPAPSSPPSLRSPSRASPPSRRTALTATCSAARSSAVEPRSGR